jgi:hypothetical protein
MTLIGWCLQCSVSSGSEGGQHVQVAATPDSHPRVKVTPFKGQKGIVSKLKLTCGGVSVEVNKVHYDKLRVLYAMAQSDPTAPFNASDFTRAACALLFRYSSLQGTHHRGGGFQVCFEGYYVLKDLNDPRSGPHMHTLRSSG